MGYAVDLAVGGRPVGVLQVAERTPGEEFAARDRRLLAALVPHLAALVRSQALTEQLEVQRDSAVGVRHRERARLRRELHDGLGPSLTGIGLGLAGLTDALTVGDDARGLAITGVLREEVGATTSEVRRILDGLAAPVFDDGLEGAIRRRVAGVAVDLPTVVRVSPLPALSSAVEQGLYRMVGEAVTNVVRHADASLVEVHVTAVDGRLRVEVRDDGAGFDQPGPTGIGLMSMRERASELDGQLLVESEPGAGTTVTLTVPIEAT